MTAGAALSCTVTVSYALVGVTVSASSAPVVLGVLSTGPAGAAGAPGVAGAAGTIGCSRVRPAPTVAGWSVNQGRARHLSAKGVDGEDRR